MGTEKVKQERRKLETEEHAQAILELQFAAQSEQCASSFASARKAVIRTERQLRKSRIQGLHGAYGSLAVGAGIASLPPLRRTAAGKTAAPGTPRGRVVGPTTSTPRLLAHRGLAAEFKKSMESDLRPQDTPQWGVGSVTVR